MKKLVLLYLFSLILFASQRISLQLNWEAQFEFAGFFIAKEKDFYKEAGLDVVIVPLDIKKPVNIQKEVLDHRVDIAVGYASVIAKAMNGKDIEVLSYLFQTSPLVGLSKQKIGDVSKKNCLYLSKNERTSSLDLLLTKLGVWCQRDYDIDRFTKDPTGIIASFISNEAYILQGYHLIEPRLYGYDFYDDIIFTSKTFYTQNKQAVRNFVLATLKGWRYALSHIDESVDIIAAKYTSKKSKTQLKAEAKTFLRYSIFSLDKVGLFNIEKVKKMISLYEENGLIKQKRSFYEFIDPLFIDSVPLSWKEREIIANTRISYSETSWPPFSLINKKGKIEGMIQDYLNIIAKRTGLEFKYIPYENWSEVLDGIKVKKLDMAMATGETEERKKWALFSDPYGVYSFAIATRRDSVITDIAELDGKVIAAGEDYTALEILKRYKGVKIKVVQDTKEALSLLEKGEIDGVADILPTLSYYIATGDYKNIIISLSLEEKFILKAIFAKNLEPIVTIFNKALHTITQEERKLISQKYSNKIVYQFNKEKEQFFVVSILVLLLLVMIFAYMAFRLKQELKRRQEVEFELHELVNHDPLTGLYNRRYFHQLLEHELKVLKRYGGYVLFAIYDIDNFKKYNDYYGHQKGDEVLIEVSQKIQELCKRENDFLFRLGGEEFGIYTRVENIQNAKNINNFLSELVRSIESLKIEHRYNTPYGVVTISLGAIIVEIKQGELYSLEKLYAQADALMYEAKKEGKNRCIVEMKLQDENK